MHLKEKSGMYSSAVEIETTDRQVGQTGRQAGTWTRQRDSQAGRQPSQQTTHRYREADSSRQAGTQTKQGQTGKQTKQRGRDLCDVAVSVMLGGSGTSSGPACETGILIDVFNTERDIQLLEQTLSY